ncbi:MAG: hypothetical protein CML00_10940 [Pseudomonas sp.]|nr:hypothetical protein [Pseudomonas sp.]
MVFGTAFMLIGENSRSVFWAVDKKMVKINRLMPKCVQAITVHDRTVLGNKAIAAVKSNLLEGPVLVIVVQFLFKKLCFSDWFPSQFKD